MVTQFTRAHGKPLASLAVSVLLTFSLTSALTGSPALAAPSISEALFETFHLEGLPEGKTLTYTFIRKPSEPKLIGEGFEDTIKLAVKEVTDDKKRDVKVSVFSGARGRDPRDISGLTGNPVLVFFLDRAVANFALLAGGNRAYHKNRFRIAMRTEGGVDAVKFQYEGKPVEGFRLAIRPFTGDRKNVHKMKGYENAQFEFYMSKAIPGYFAGFKSHYSSPKPGSPTLDETILLQGIDLGNAELTNAAAAGKAKEATKAQ